MTVLNFSLLKNAASALEQPFPFTRCLLQMFNNMGFGALLLDRDGRVVDLNEGAAARLGDGLLIQNGKLAAQIREDKAALHAFLQAAFDQWDRGEALDDQPVTCVPRRQKRGVILRGAGLSPDVSGLLGAAMIVLILDPEECPKPKTETLRQLFGLTCAEVHVATELMCGATLEEIAERRGVSAGTVRAQMKSVLAKTETTRQADLVGLLTRLAVLSR